LRVDLKDAGLGLTDAGITLVLACVGGGTLGLTDAGLGLTFVLAGLGGGKDVFVFCDWETGKFVATALFLGGGGGGVLKGIPVFGIGAVGVVTWEGGWAEFKACGWTIEGGLGLGGGVLKGLLTDEIGAVGVVTWTGDVVTWEGGWAEFKSCGWIIEGGLGGGGGTGLFVSVLSSW
jgi:hypothetical protein